MAVLVVGETGKTVRLSSGGYDMSSNTSIDIRFTKPSGTVVDKTATLGTTQETFDDGIGTVEANEWAFYDVDDATLLDAAGSWKARLVYGDTGAAPAQNFIGIQAAFEVIA